MNSHKNARLTPKGRASLIEKIKQLGLQTAAREMAVSTHTARKWQRRFASHGAAGLFDRTSRPGRCRSSCPRKIERSIALRKNHGLHYARIGERVGLPTSTVARHCVKAGVHTIKPKEAVMRYEKQHAGELLHLDTKKLARFDRPGHRVTDANKTMNRKAGYEALHVAIDDHSRVLFAQVLGDETAKAACAFTLAALRHYKALGVKVQAILTDNGSAYRSRRFAKMLRRLKIEHKRTRAYRPQTNGKAERVIQTLLKEWAYAFMYPSSEHRKNELPFWLDHYNFFRPHSAIENQPPASRLGLEVNNVVRNYT